MLTKNLRNICTMTKIDMMTQKQTQTNDCLVLFQKLPRLNDKYEAKEDGEFIPSLYWMNGKWYISWDDDAGRVIDIYWASTVDEVVREAYEGLSSKKKITFEQ